MMTNDAMLRHLLDLCRKSERTGTWQYSAFLSPAEQDDLLSCADAAWYSFFLTGGYEGAERKILAAGNETEQGPPEVPVSVIAVAPKSAKFAEELFPQDDYAALRQMELPVDEPLDLYREPYGGFLTAAMCALILLGAAALILEIVIGEMSIPVILCSVGLMVGGYALHVCKKLLHDLEEIKKRFR